jgi:hypothetical protein
VAQAIEDGEIEWKPLHLLNNVSSSIGSVMKPAAREWQGVISPTTSRIRPIRNGRTMPA